MRELTIIPITNKINPVNGQFLKQHVPHNKGVPMKEWMDGRKIRKVIKGLQRTGNPNLAGWNAKPIIAIRDDGREFYFDCSNDAMRKTGIESRNIRSVCNGKRKKAGGFEWKYA